jgi:Tfp pilus assembly protein PilF
VIVVAAAVLSTRWTRAWLAGSLFFVVAIVPTLGIFRYTSSVAANRSMYLPMVGLLLPINWEMNRLLSAVSGTLNAYRLRALLAGLGATLVVGSTVILRDYESHWSDTLTLLRYYLSQAPHDWKLHTRMGDEWIRLGEYPSAIDEFRAAVHSDPTVTETHLNLGRGLFTAGEYAQAKEALAEALVTGPGDWRGHLLMGMTLDRQKDLEGALAEFQTASRLAPSRGLPHYHIANVLKRQGKRDEAAQEYRESLRLEPQFTDARKALDSLNLGR